MIENLPASLQIVQMPYRREGAANVRAARAHFSKDIKPAFLQYLAENNVGQLAAMGITPAGLEWMLLGKFPRNVPGERMDCSIDHIVSLAFGGTNDFDNLMLIPARINAMKNNLEMPQLDGDREGTLTTIVPFDNAHVPFIEGGFQREKKLDA